MKEFRVVYRPEAQLKDRVIEADEVSWPDEEWGMVGFYNGKYAETLVATVRYELVAMVLVGQLAEGE